MRRTLILGTTIAVIVIILGAYIGWTLLNPQQATELQPTPAPTASPTPQTTPSASPEPENVTQEQARDAVMTYIKANHVGTGQLMMNLNWTGGRVTPEGVLGYETYAYSSTNWNATVEYPVIPYPPYTINVSYASGVVSVVWEGTYQNGTINETKYSQTNLIVTLTQDEIRDAVLAFMQERHNETAQLLINATWTGGRVEIGRLGAELYNYTSANWTITIQYPITQRPTYTIVASYASGDVTVTWEGTYKNGAITQTNYYQNNLVILTTQEQVRDAAIAYIRANHNETAVYMQDLMWIGGRVVPLGLIVGSETYSYQSPGWNVTMQYPVRPDPVYTVTASYYSPLSQVSPARNIIVWSGTWQNKTITETSYNFTP